MTIEDSTAMAVLDAICRAASILRAEALALRTNGIAQRVVVTMDSIGEKCFDGPLGPRTSPSTLSFNGYADLSNSLRVSWEARLTWSDTGWSIERDVNKHDDFGMLCLQELPIIRPRTARELAVELPSSLNELYTEVAAWIAAVGVGKA